MVMFSAWPMCRLPVMFGGGITMLNLGRSDSAFARKAARSSQRRVCFSSTWAKSNRFSIISNVLAAFCAVRARKWRRRYNKARRKPTAGPRGRCQARSGSGNGLVAELTRQTGGAHHVRIGRAKVRDDRVERHVGVGAPVVQILHVPLSSLVERVEEGVVHAVER